MAFFRAEEKRLARRYTKQYLKKGYERTEKGLINACKTGKVKNVEYAMKKHRKYEYALLYKEFLNSNKNKIKEKQK